MCSKNEKIGASLVSVNVFFNSGERQFFIPKLLTY